MLQAEELRRPIRRNEILEGRENDEMEDMEDGDNLIALAEARGIETRIMIMDNLPPNLD